MRRWSRNIVAGLIGAAAVLSQGSAALAADTEGCLNCHQYRGLARIDAANNRVQNFFVDPEYYSRGLGPHARLKCTDCHQKTDVEVFPHKPMTPVDCARACHLQEPGKVEVRFSHDRVQHMLAGSVHGKDVLAKANRALGSPLKESQATCLLCHDEPRFAGGKAAWAKADAPVQRCNTCHNESLPQDTAFSFWHVQSRSHPARSQQETVAVCGMCHSDKRIQREFDLPDATASYLASFHGKAVLLGNHQAAACLDCHVSPMQNVHVMKAKVDPLSPTHSSQIADTCRSESCHPTAGAKLSTASVHLNLPTSRGIEFFIGVVFVLLILTTFGPSLMICVMELVHMAFGRRTGEHERHVKHTQELLKNPEARRRLKRFNVHQRLQHWFLVLTFATLCVTGFPMKFADREWSARVIELLGGLTTARNLHHYAGAALIVGFFYHLIYIAWTVVRNKRKTGDSWWKTVWDLPMMLKPADGLFMLNLMLYMVGLRKKHPPAGRFNPEEKFEYIGVFWGTFVLGVTGVLMWANAWTTRSMPGRVLTIASLLHTFEAFLALLHVGIVHLAGVIFSPTVFPVSKAMFTGDTPAEELAEGHSEMVEAVEKELGAAGPAGSAHV